jgi:outer membrane receptor protein involved in Fe transport
LSSLSGKALGPTYTRPRANYWVYGEHGSYASNLLEAHGTVKTSENTSPSFSNDSWWNLGIFGQGEFGIQDQLFLTASVRVEDNPHLGEAYGRAVSPQAGAPWVRDVGSGQLKLRAQCGKGVRPPPDYARTGRVLSDGIYLPNPDIGPEEKIGWDAGVELYFGRSTKLSVTRFSEEGRNLIMWTSLDESTAPPTRQYRNIGRVRARGWEMEGQLELGPVMLNANCAYSDNVIRELSEQYQESQDQWYQVGDRMELVPTHSGGGSVSVDLLKGSVGLNASVIDEWRAFDLVGLYSFIYGGESYRGTMRDYMIDYSDPFWQWNLRAEQEVREGLTGFMRIENLANNQASAMHSLDVSREPTTVLGVRFTY